MPTIPKVAAALQAVLTEGAAGAAQLSGVIQRVRAFTGPTLVQTLVLGWLADPHATLQQLRQMAARLGVSVSAQAIDQRFGPALADCLWRVLEAALCRVVTTDPVALPL
jgi:hypothetical protein